MIIKEEERLMMYNSTTVMSVSQIKKMLIKELMKR